MQPDSSMRKECCFQEGGRLGYWMRKADKKGAVATGEGLGGKRRHILEEDQDVPDNMINRLFGPT